MTQGTAFELRVTVIPPGGQAAYREADWRDALVLVESGDVELECEGGSRERFGCVVGQSAAGRRHLDVTADATQQFGSGFAFELGELDGHG